MLLGWRLPVCAEADCGCAAKGTQDISGVLLPEGMEVGAITPSRLGMEGDIDVFQSTNGRKVLALWPASCE